MPTLANLPQHIYIFAAILGVLLFSFFFFFFLPSTLVSIRLSTVARKLKALPGKPDSKLDRIFEKKGVLEHLWRKYSATLHKQPEADSVPGHPATRMRSTMPAGVIFRPEIIVD